MQSRRCTFDPHGRAMYCSVPERVRPLLPPPHLSLSLSRYYADRFPGCEGPRCAARSAEKTSGYQLLVAPLPLLHIGGIFPPDEIFRRVLRKRFPPISLLFRAATRSVNARGGFPLSGTRRDTHFLPTRASATTATGETIKRRRPSRNLLHLFFRYIYIHTHTYICIYVYYIYVGIRHYSGRYTYTYLACFTPCVTKRSYVHKSKSRRKNIYTVRR